MFTGSSRIRVPFLFCLALLFGFSGAARADGLVTSIAPPAQSFTRPEAEDARIIGRYLAAVQQQQTALRGVQMEVNIDAALPKLKKWGSLHALRYISKVGKVTYRMLGFSGDTTVKKDVIARYLTAEVQAQGPHEDISISPANYKFKFKGLEEIDGQRVYVFHLSPRKKRVGLFKGELWLDPDTCMPMREEGRFVKSPSIFFKRVEFVREYAMNGGVTVPRHIESRVDTRLVGRVELNIDFTNPAKAADSVETGTPAGGTE